MSLMNKEQRLAKNAEQFRRSLTTLFSAGVGVVLCRTREPYRAIDVVRKYAFADKKEFQVWSVLRGWEKYNRANPTAAPIADNLIEPIGAMKAIMSGADDGLGMGVFVSFYPQPYFKNAVFIQQVKEYCRGFPQTAKRLVLMTPMGFTLPQELEDDITVLDFDVPAYSELAETYDDVMSGVPDAKRPKLSADDKDRLLSCSAGLTAHEAEAALSRAMIEHRTSLPNVNVEQLAEEVMKVKIEAVKKTDILEIMPGVSMSDVGGLENLKEWVAKRRSAYSDEARAFGIRPPKGIVLAGPPGTGKSHVSKAIAAVMGLPLLKFDIGKVFGSLVGETEGKVRATLKMIDAMAPCVVLFDEVDKQLGGAQSGGGDSGVTKRVLGTILTWMQETKSPVFNVLTLNRVEAMPPELLRRGRLDEVFSVSVPDADERRAILQIHLRLRGHESDVEGLEEAVENSEGYVPAELEAAVADALIEAFNTPDRKITGKLIAEQLEGMVPLSQAFAEDFERMKTWAEQNARSANKRKESTAPGSRPRVRQRPSSAPQLVAGGSGRQMQLDG